MGCSLALSWKPRAQGNMARHRLAGWSSGQHWVPCGGRCWSPQSHQFLPALLCLSALFGCWFPSMEKWFFCLTFTVVKFLERLRVHHWGGLKDVFNHGCKNKNSTTPKMPQPLSLSENSKCRAHKKKKKKKLLYLNALSSHCALSKKELSNDDLGLSWLFLHTNCREWSRLAPSAFSSDPS